MVPDDGRVVTLGVAAGVGVFASVSADGSVRVFDLRDKEHSTIIYESPQPENPLLRIGWNKQDARYMATTHMDSSKVRLRGAPIQRIENSA